MWNIMNKINQQTKEKQTHRQRKNRASCTPNLSHKNISEPGFPGLQGGKRGTFPTLGPPKQKPGYWLLVKVHPNTLSVKCFFCFPFSFPFIVRAVPEILRYITLKCLSNSNVLSGTLARDNHNLGSKFQYN